MVSVLTKIFGAEHLQMAEDVVQDTLLKAMNTWIINGIPNNPSAWLYTVAKNKAMDIIRRNKHSKQFDFSDNEKILLTSNYTFSETMDSFWAEDLVKDDMLRMMFTCCHPEISDDSQVTLILKTLCGFSTEEIAKAFLTSEDTISKRLYRTKEFFREKKVKLVIPSVDELKQRTDAVLNSIYLLFNEGYNSTSAEELIREDLIAEAMRLCALLMESEYTRQPEVYALMALMCFHASRTQSRLSTAGEIILLPRQDRCKWNYNLINEGNELMNKAAFGNVISKYHIEAAIAFEHCTAPNFESTNWHKILEYYTWLGKIAPSPIAELNKAVAILQVHGPAKALTAIEKISDKKKLETFYLYHSLLGEIHSRLNNTTLAKKHFETAIEQTHSETEKKMLRNKVESIE